MTNEEEDKKFMIVGIVIMLVAFGVFLAYVTAHYNGYKHGIQTAEFYYEYTGEFPPDDWARRTSRSSLGSMEAIEKKLYPFGKN